MFVIAILGGNKFFCHFKEKEILVHERSGDVFRGDVKFDVKFRNFGSMTKKRLTEKSNLRNFS